MKELSVKDYELVSGGGGGGSSCVGWSWSCSLCW
ncbi:hypothetical protein MIDG2331_01946 [Actinobacillus pleuropneumoniae serovar 8]|nr:hypothetical protein MIDG2331_01946 [Actinobacillus pleuropneumoniae serovar 8]